MAMGCADEDVYPIIQATVLMEHFENNCPARQSEEAVYCVAVPHFYRTFTRTEYAVWVSLPMIVVACSIPRGGITRE